MRIVKLHNRNLLVGLQEMVHNHFPDDTAIYCAMDDQAYRGIVAGCQHFMNVCGMAQALAKNMREEIEQALQSDDVMIQSKLYLRATRPVGARQEYVGWHRESFYGTEPEAVNFWMPVSNVTPENTLQYIIGSDAIPDGAIGTMNKDDPATPQHSAGHEIGLLYSPKTIVCGVDLSLALPMDVPIGSVVIFPGALIHGAAVNNTDKIRFSVDFRMIARKHMRRSEYFTPMEAA